MLGGTPKHSTIGNIHRDILLFGIITLQHVIQNNCRWVLMVLSDGMVHFLKIKKKKLTNLPKLSLWLTSRSDALF